MLSAGIVGTAKNTGKTSTLTYLMKQELSKGKNIAVTGIGYDGEEIDNITNLPKPRFYFESGTIIATAEKCLNSSEADYEIIKTTDIYTALGKIIIAKIKRPAMVVIAGPNTFETLKFIQEEIKKTNTDILLVDGSLNRLSPISVVDKIIFTTGAARNTDINFLTSEMAEIEDIFFLSAYSGDNKIFTATFALIDEDDINQITKKIKKEINLYIKGFFNLRTLLAFIKKKQEIHSIIFDSPISVLISLERGEFTILKQISEEKGILLYVKKKLSLAAVTINPFYPKLMTNIFSPEYIDKEILFETMSKRLRTRVYNITNQIPIKI